MTRLMTKGLSKFSRSDFSADLLAVMADERTLEIVEVVDLNLGGMSVTNDVENVINTVAQALPNPATDYAWIYRDSEGLWDELVLDKVGNFSRFAALPRGRCQTELRAEAVVRLIARELEAAT